MGQQTVISHSYTQAQRNPVEHQSGIERRPVEEEKGSDGPNVKESETVTDIQLIPSRFMNGLAIVSISSSLDISSRLSTSRPWQVECLNASVV